MFGIQLLVCSIKGILRHFGKHTYSDGAWWAVLPNFHSLCQAKQNVELSL